ncbi:MAG: ABC transporter ATP-binding protein [Clostridia bacterium]|nr:ABC transporter ATP-binding protein [Clostridia bacterium]
MLITEIKNLSFSFGDKAVLQDINFHIEEGEVLSVLSPNGGGKTTLFRCILGIMRDYTGTILFNGSDIRTMKAKKLSRYAAYVPQSHYPLFNYTVEEMVLMGTTPLLNHTASPKVREKELAREALFQMGIEHLSERGFMQLSGGEQRLVLIARALSRHPPLLVLDEPTAELDIGHQSMVLSHISALRSSGFTVLMSTHDPSQAYAHSTRVLALSDGKVLAIGTPENVILESLLKELYSIDNTITRLPDGNIHITA